MFRDLSFLLKLFFTAFFCVRKKVFLVSSPTHPNLGDQAQTMCTEIWIKKNFPNYKLIELGDLCIPFANSPKEAFLNKVLLNYLVLKLTVRKKDIFIGHSGYFFVDHHGGWFSFEFVLKYFPENKMIILPQTINFYTPVIIERASKSFENKANLTLLCRDEVSYRKAHELFGRTKLLLYPDVVTSLIGTRHFDGIRDGVLFCMRNDIEAYYKPDQIDTLMKLFNHVRTEKIDTTINVSEKELAANRDKFINDMLAKFATFRVVITDRYHGTIFSAIASTPVVVINSADHKLSSGVKWFPEEIFFDNVQFAQNLDDAYVKANNILSNKNRLYLNPTYFKNMYWDRLMENLL